MIEPVNIALVEYEKLVSDGAKINRVTVTPLQGSMDPVQSAYVSVLEEALGHLAQADLELSQNVLREHRSTLEPAREKVGSFIQSASHDEDPYLKLVLEFLYTRTRLIEELQLFPTFGLSMLERYSIEQSIEETIHHLEDAMTGKKGLFEKLNDAFDSLET